VNRTLLRTLLISALLLATVAYAADSPTATCARLAAPVAAPGDGHRGPIPAILFRSAL
jgi:hypothetical protein